MIMPVQSVSQCDRLGTGLQATIVGVESMLSLNTVGPGSAVTCLRAKVMASVKSCLLQGGLHARGPALSFSLVLFRFHSLGNVCPAVCPPSRMGRSAWHCGCPVCPLCPPHWCAGVPLSFLLCSLKCLIQYWAFLLLLDTRCPLLLAALPPWSVALRSLSVPLQTTVMLCCTTAS